MAQILARSGLAGVGVGMDIGAYNEVFPNVPGEFAYLKCLLDVLMEVRRLTSPDGIPDDLRIEQVKFTFDSRKQTNHNAGQLYEIVSNLRSTTEGSPIIGPTIRFDTRANPRIQMADLLARETMKYLDNIIGPKRRGTRKSMQALIETNPLRFWFTYLTREWAEDKKRKEAETQKMLNMSIEGFAAWLKERHLFDNWSNRLRWLRDQEN